MREFLVLPGIEGYPFIIRFKTVKVPRPSVFVIKY